YMTTHGFNRGYQAYLGQDGKKGMGRRGGEDHYANFIRAVRARDRNLLTAEIGEGHISAALCHLANAAFRVQRALRFDPESQHIIGDTEADDIIQGKTRKYRAPFTVPEEV
ncbi:MAG TPA: gfo/Idh/MocA family oxidoreductase, partial [bacterium]|nr:gfo/Idh/MocA family oxidoreductase [bacterium]